jgi:hypothetical protein
VTNNFNISANLILQYIRNEFRAYISDQVGAMDEKKTEVKKSHASVSLRDQLYLRCQIIFRGSDSGM